MRSGPPISATSSLRYAISSSASSQVIPASTSPDLGQQACEHSIQRLVGEGSMGIGPAAMPTRAHARDPSNVRANCNVCPEDCVIGAADQEHSHRSWRIPDALLPRCRTGEDLAAGPHLRAPLFGEPSAHGRPKIRRATAAAVWVRVEPLKRMTVAPGTMLRACSMASLVIAAGPPMKITRAGL